MTRWSALLCLALLPVLAGNRALAEHPPAGKIRIADRAGEDFASIQSAIEAAANDATVLIGAGRYDERLKIGKPIKLVGAGPDKTIIGPTAAGRAEHIQKFRALGKTTVEPWQAWMFSGKTPDNSKKRLAVAEMRALSAAIIKIEDVQGIELRALRVTSPGTASGGGGSEGGFHAIELKNAGLRMTDCAVVGCVGDGVNVTGQSNLEIDDCLIGGSWNNGVSATGLHPTRLKIVNSDVRNCYRTNIWANTLDNVFTAEGCRISGSACLGVRCGGRTTIVRSAIFENHQVGIEAMADVVLKQNLILANHMRGVVCGPKTKSWLEGNLFRGNVDAICVSGESAPTIRRNVFVGGSSAVEYQPHGIPNGLIPATRNYQITENLFWSIDQPVVRRDLVGEKRVVQTEVIALPESDKNRVENPQISLDSTGHAVLAEGSPARQIDFDGITAATMKSRWPLTDEERAMLPEDGSRDVSRWRLKLGAAGP